MLCNDQWARESVDRFGSCVHSSENTRVRNVAGQGQRCADKPAGAICSRAGVQVCKEIGRGAFGMVRTCKMLAHSWACPANAVRN